MKDWASILVQIWVFKDRSKDTMKMGPINEDDFMFELIQKEYIVDLFDCGMFQMSDDNYLAFSPGGSSLLDLKFKEERAHTIDDLLGLVDVNGKP